MAEFTAGNACRQTKIADSNLLVYDAVGKSVGALGHGSDKDTDALLGTECVDIVPYLNQGCVKAQGDLAAVGRQMISDGVLDHAQKLLLRVGRADGQTMKQLYHETGKALESPRDAHRGRYLNQDTLGSVDEDL